MNGGRESLWNDGDRVVVTTEKSTFKGLRGTLVDASGRRGWWVRFDRDDRRVWFSESELARV